MRYSLLSRFQAVLLGMALGEALEIDSRRSLRSDTPDLGFLPNLSFSAWQPQRLSPNSPAIARMVQAAEPLIQSAGRALGSQSSLPLGPPPSTRDWLAASLPIALFFHDDEIKLRQALVQTVSPESLAGALAVSTAIAQALREQLQPINLIPQTIALLEQSLEVTPRLADLLEQLAQVQVGLEQHVSLHTMAARLQPPLAPMHRTIAIAFYCCLSTPEDFQRAIVRSVQVSQSPGAALIVGAIAGAHNSTIGIPLAWSRVRTTIAIGSENSPEPDLEQLASRLWAVWSGALEPELSRLKLEAIAAPNVIRFR